MDTALKIIKEKDPKFYSYILKYADTFSNLQLIMYSEYLQYTESKIYQIVSVQFKHNGKLYDYIIDKNCNVVVGDDVIVTGVNGKIERVKVKAVRMGELSPKISYKFCALA